MNIKIHSSIKYIFVIGLFLTTQLISTLEMYAIPAFARKYKTSCNTCHVAITKRNPFGEAFRRNGYVLPEQTPGMIKDVPLKLGTDAWKDIWPGGIWPSTIPGTIPISMYSGFGLQNNLENNANPRLVLDMPLDFGFLFAGTFSDDISFFGSWSYKFGNSRLFMRFKDLLNLNNLLNLKIGKFEPGINDAQQGNQRITSSYNILQDYAPGGDWSSKKSHSGFELNGLFYNDNFNYQIGLVNSIGYDKSNSLDKFDYYFRLGYKIGGLNFSGSNLNPEIPQDNFKDINSLMISVFDYQGNNLKNSINNQTFNNEFSRIGADIKYSYDNLDLIGGIMFGEDQKADTSFKKLESLCYFGELNYLIYPWIIAVLRYENASSNYSNYEKESYSNFIPNITMLVRQNVRVTIEALLSYNHNIKRNGIEIEQNNNEIFKNIKLLAFFVF